MSLYLVHVSAARVLYVEREVTAAHVELAVVHLVHCLLTTNQR